MKFVLLAFGVYAGYNYFQTKAAQADPVDSALNVLMVAGSAVSVLGFLNAMAKD